MVGAHQMMIFWGFIPYCMLVQAIQKHVLPPSSGWPNLAQADAAVTLKMKEAHSSETMVETHYMIQCKDREDHHLRNRNRQKFYT
jgi:hypothetical protein